MVEDYSFLSLQEQEVLCRFREAVEKICGPEGWKLTLFGSRARSEGNEDSDLDVLVLLDDYEEEKKIRIWDAAYEVFGSSDILISPMVLSRAFYEDLKRRERLIAVTIEREGIAL